MEREEQMDEFHDDDTMTKNTSDLRIKRVGVSILQKSDLPINRAGVSFFGMNEPQQGSKAESGNDWSQGHLSCQESKNGIGSSMLS